MVNRRHRRPFGSLRRLAALGGGMLLGTVLPAAFGAQAGAASAPPEIAGITTACIGVPGELGTPYLEVTLYNLPSNASPTASGTISTGNVTTPLSFLPDFGAYVLTATQGLSRGSQPVTVSIKWSDGVGGTGSVGPQIVGVSTCVATSRRASAIASDATGTRYWEVTSDGSVSGFPGKLDYGDMSYIPLNAPIVGIASTVDGDGYWLVGADGGVFSFGTAHFFGSTGSLRLNAPIVGIVATPDDGGYWLVAKDGGVFTFGDAPFFGSMGGKPLNQPIVGMAVDQATDGYWHVAADGGIFSFNAPFHGSAANLKLNASIVGMQAAPDGSGYRLVAGDGGVFTFDLAFAGSYAGKDPFPIMGIAGQGSTGYWLIDACGSVYNFGSAPFYNGVIVC